MSLRNPLWVYQRTYLDGLGLTGPMPHLGSMFAAGCAVKARLDVGLPEVIEPAVRVHGDVVRAFVVGAVR